MHSLECLYSMSQFSEFMCNLIVQQHSNATAFEAASSPKMISLLVNFLTVDTTHFGVNRLPTAATAVPVKVSKIMPTNANLVIPSNQNLPNASQTSNQAAIQNKATSLLQQTLHNQHNISATTLSTSNGAKIQPSNSQLTTSSKQSTQEQNAKNILCNWLVTCFQPEANSELSKTQLYPYYQQIAKLNSWFVLIYLLFQKR